MNEIKCPNCGQVFPIDEAGYTAIAQQIRDKEFEKALKKQLDKEIELKTSEISKSKDEEIGELKLKLQQVRSDMKQLESDHNSSVKDAVAEKEKEIVLLNEQIKRLKDAEKLNTKIAVDKAEKDVRDKYEEQLEKKNEELAQKRDEISDLNSKLTTSELKKQIEIQDAVSKVEKERDTIKAGLESQIKVLKDEIESEKNAKAKLSTKMIGETLEKHCENSFNMVRAMAFKNAEFGKDNTVTDGTKGDYIYRENDEDGNEIISIMFEMKNEMDETKTKHKNADFFAKLDKDRKNKNCEYAILVSLLEKDSELYNQGIVDVSYEYDRMYVIRPQFFIPIISILRNAAMNSMKYKRKLKEIRNQEIDIAHFEERIENFKSGFSKNYELAKKHFDNAIKEIDNTIDHLKKVKDSLMKSTNNLRLANDKAQKQLTIKALTKDNETMIEMFDELNKDIDV